MESTNLDLFGIIAFDGTIKNALHLHPDKKHLIFPMGAKIMIKNLETKESTFLDGHTDLLSALCISKCGSFIASGQINHFGYKAMVIIWNYKENMRIGSYEIHKTKVEDVRFSCNNKYLISLGGRDDGNIIVWDVENQIVICGSFVGNETGGIPYAILPTNIHSQYYLSAGNETLKFWHIDFREHKTYGVEAKLGKLKRLINCMIIDETDDNVYCGTSSGDIVKAKLSWTNHGNEKETIQSLTMIGCYSKITKGSQKMSRNIGDLYAGGVKNLLLINDGKLIVGAGNGAIELIEIVYDNIDKNKITKPLCTPQIVTHQKGNVCSSVTSMIMNKEDSIILVGTILCEIYQVKLSNFGIVLLATCHDKPVYGIGFPCDYSEIFATASKNYIRVWRLKSQQELLRITLPNLSCLDLCFSRDGQLIISAWNDGSIRAFAALGGRHIFAIHNAHVKGVSAITISNDDTKLISGGYDGQVRIWDLKLNVQRLINALKEHRGPITSLAISHINNDLISTSTDGTCILWDIKHATRKRILMGNAMYTAACFGPNDVQILTCGTDRKIAYWETWDGSLIRQIEGSNSGTINCIDISPDGRYFVTGSDDRIVKVWEYHAANVNCIGIVHATTVIACKFSPNGKYIITASKDGAVIIWMCPFKLVLQETNKKTVGPKTISRLGEKQ